MRKQHIKFFYKAGFLFFPFFIILLFYLYLDPFKVIYRYDSYYQKGTTYVGTDRDYVSTQTFINNYPEFKYNSFIFGNSRSRYYEIDTWKNYIHTNNCFHFDASGESLLGIYRKIKFLRDRNVNISNALIILDYSTLNNITEMTDYLRLSHPVLSNQNRVSFQLVFFKQFLSHDFFKAYWDFIISRQFKDYMANNFLLNNTPIEYISKYNEIQLKYYEEQIRINPINYYNENKMKVFYSRDSIQKYSPKTIYESQYKMLKEILEILKSTKTKFKIIINPLYDQLKLNINDMKIMYDLFGKENVYDFSGINSITNDYHNYYENSHYRPHVANYILKEIYKIE